ncbi:MAG: diaminopimelate epimerase [Gemmatimonadota bacterium]|nr:diaminopimelate epimerase [Gemmatimonadota bacterium]
MVEATFFKAHGHGNDYLVFPAGSDLPLTPRAIRILCDRWRGVGGDGVVVVGPGSDGATASLRMFNPDGSEFERSGNGLRIAALYLFDRGLVGHDPFVVRVSGDDVRMCVGEGAVPAIRAEMGRVGFPTGPPFVRPGSLAADGQLVVPGAAGALPVSVGNPHAVLFGDSWTRGDLAHLGPMVSSHEAFPQGTNVQLVHRVGSQSLSMFIWERGVGRTASSGTSACAAAAAAVKTGRLDPGAVTVRMEGGQFRVTVGADYAVVLEGPVQAVCSGELDARLIASTADVPPEAEG